MSNRNYFAHEMLGAHESPETLEEDQLEKIYNYLENPTHHGIWKFEGTWIKEGIFQDLDQQLTLKIEKSKENTPKLRRLKKELPRIRERINKFSFIFSLFTSLMFLEGDETEEDEYYQLIFDELDLPTIKEKYLEAYNFFKEEIYLNNSNIRIRSNNLTKIKNSFFMLLETEKDRISERSYQRRFGKSPPEKIFTFVSLEKEGLEKICTFFDKIKKIRNFSIKPRYSPEEAVFLPYIYLLEASYLSFIENDTSKKLIKKAISNYNNGDYSDCVGSIGLVAEEYLSQIYETLFRNTAPKIPLGAFYDNLHKKIRDKIYEKQIIPSKDNLIRKIDANSGRIIDQSNLRSLLKMVVKLMEDKDSYLLNELKEKQNISYEKSIFPRDLRENLKELLFYRNAVSHRSNINLGQENALKAVYSCISLIRWWQKEYDLINWSQGEKEIILQIIENSNQ